MELVQSHSTRRFRPPRKWLLILALLWMTLADVAAEPHDAPSHNADAGEAANSVPGGMTLKEAARLAVLKNPRLSAYSWDIRAAEAAGIQASVRPNPQLSGSSVFKCKTGRKGP